jgi:hypothetical protein
MRDQLSYQVREVGKPLGNVWNAVKDSTCAEWAASPEGKEVVVRNNFTDETYLMPRGEAESAARAYNKLRDAS